MKKYQFAINCATEEEIKNILGSLVSPEDSPGTDEDPDALVGTIVWPRFSCTTLSGSSWVNGEISYSSTGYLITLTITRGLFQWLLYYLQLAAFLGAWFLIVNSSYSIPIRGGAAALSGIIAYPIIQFLLQTDAQKTITLFKKRFGNQGHASTFA